MARQNIDIGIQGNDGTGDSIRESFRKVNENFIQLYSIFGEGDTISFKDLDDTPKATETKPNGYGPDQVIVADAEGSSLLAKDLVGGEGIAVDHTDENEIRIISTGGKVENDIKPKLGSYLNAQNFSIGNFRDPSEEAASQFNDVHLTNITEDNLIISKGYADQRYLQASGGTGSGGQIRVREEPVDTSEYTRVIDSWPDGYARIPDHGLNSGANGIAFRYYASIAPATGLTIGQTYYLRYVDKNRLSVHATKEDAQDGNSRIVVNDPEVLIRGTETFVDAYYDPTLPGNWLSIEALPRKSVVRRQGDIMEGALVLHDHPGTLAGSGSPNGADDLQAATKFYVDSSSYASNVNLFVATNGDDEQTLTPPGKEGRAFAYAYETVGGACAKAEEIIDESLKEPGPYRQVLTYGNTNNICYLNDVTVQPAANRVLKVFSNGAGVDQSKDINNRDLREGSIIKGLRSGATARVIDYNGIVSLDDVYEVELLHTEVDLTNYQTDYFTTSAKLDTNKDFIKAEVIEYIKAKYPSLIFDEVKCSRDAGLIVDALVFDTKFGGNRKSIKAGRSYWNGVTSVLPPGQVDETIDGINYINLLAQAIIDNTLIPDVGEPDTLGLARRSAQIQSVAGATGEAGSDVIIARLISSIKNIVEHGPGGNPSTVYNEFIDDEPLEFGQPVPETQITIRIESGVYYEQLPIRVPTNVSIKGDEFRRSIIRPAPGESQSPWAGIYFRRDSSIDGLTRTYLSNSLAASSLGNVVTLSSGDLTVDGLEVGMYLKVTAGTGTITKRCHVTRILTTTTFEISETPTVALSGATVRGLNGSGFAPIGSNFGYHYLIDPDDATSPPKSNKDMDMFLLNDGTILRNITAQSHGGFMCVLDPEGQIQTKSPYFQTATSLSGSVNKKAFRGGMFIDGFTGNLPATINSRTNSTTIVMGGLTVREPGVPTAFYIGSYRYQIVAVENYNQGLGTATVTLDESTPWPVNNPDTVLPWVYPYSIIIETPGNRSMLCNDFTQVNDLGYGIVATNNGLCEAVSVFTYYNHISYLANNGAQIRSVAGSSCNGEFGLKAAGRDPNEVPDPVVLADNTLQTAKIYKRASFASKNVAEDQSVYIDYYQYKPFNITEIEIDHTNTRSSIVENTGLTPNNIVIANGGTGYAVNDYFEADGGTLYPGGSKSRFRITEIDGGVPGPGVVTDIELVEVGDYSVNPAGSTSLAATLVVNTSNIATVERVGSTATVTTALAHGLSNGDFVNVICTSDITFNSIFVSVTVVDPVTFTYTNSGSAVGALTPAVGTVTSGNTITLTSGTTAGLGAGMVIEAYAGSVGAFGSGSQILNVVDPTTLTVDAIHTAAGVVTFKIYYGGYPNNIGSFTTTAETPSLGSGCELSATFLGTIQRYEISNVENTTSVGLGVDVPGVLGTRIVLKCNLNVQGGSGLYSSLQDGQTIVLRGLQNFRFDDVFDISPTRPSTALEFTDPEESGIVYRTLAYSTSYSTGESLPANQAVLKFDTSFNYVILQTKEDKISDTDYVDGGLKTMGATIGDTRIAVATVNSAVSQARLNSGNMITTWAGKLHGIIGYTASATVSFNVSTASWLANVATITTAAPHGFVNGDEIIITGIVSSGQPTYQYNGTFIITVTGLSTFEYTYAAGDPGTYTSGGVAKLETQSAYVEITDFAYGSGTIVTGGPAGLAEGFTVTRSTNIRAGLPSNAPAEITVNISTCRATSHDFLDVGSGGFNSTNYPNSLLGSPVVDPDPTKIVVEETQGRVFHVSTDQDGIFRVGRFFEVDQGTGTVTFAASIALSNLDGIGFKRGTVVKEFSTDDTFTDNDDDTVPVESAIQGYIDRRLGYTRTGAIVTASERLPAGGGFLPIIGTPTLEADLSMGSIVGHRITNLVTNPASGTDAANVTFVNTQVAARDSWYKLKEVLLMSPATNDLPVFIGGGRVVISSTPTGDVLGTLTSTNLTTLAVGISGTSQLDVGGGIEVSDITGFPSSGYIQIGTEIFSYTSITLVANRFDDITRAAANTTATIHSAGAQVTGLDNSRFDLQIQPGVIVDNDVNVAAAIQQSKLAMAIAATSAAAPAGTAAAIQAANGLSSFDSANFEITNGWVGIKSGGVALGEIQNIAAGRILGNLTGSPAAPQEVTTTGIVENGVNSLFTAVDAGANVMTRRYDSMKPAITTFTNILGTPGVGGSGSFSNIPVSNVSGNGNGALVTVGYNAGTYSGITVTYGGNGYAEGDQLIIPGNLLGGATPANDLAFDIEITGTNIDTTVYLGVQKVSTQAETDSIVKTDVVGNLGNVYNKFNNIYSTVFTGNLSGNAATSTTSTNLAGGELGSIPYQTAAGATTQLSPGTTGRYLKTNGPGAAPSWAELVIPDGSAENLTGTTLAGTVVNSSLTSFGDLIKFSTNASITAAGTDQAGATALTKMINIVTTVAVDTGVRLPTAVAGYRLIIRNNGANNLNIYPASGAQIGTLGSDAPATLEPSTALEYFATSATQWYNINTTFA